MRPVNLIPPEERSGERRPMRGGPLAYVIVGALAAAVIGVAALAITGNQIAESKAEIASLEEETAAVEAQAQALDAYTQFHALREQRVATITSLADSRFDWERVMRELALILPDDVWLTNLTGTAAAGVSVEGATSVSLRGSIPGPALEARRLRSQPRRRRRLHPGDQGDRWRHPCWGAHIGDWRIRRRILVIEFSQWNLPDPRLHRPVPDGRRLRRGSGCQHERN